MSDKPGFIDAGLIEGAYVRGDVVLGTRTSEFTMGTSNGVRVSVVSPGAVDDPAVHEAMRQALKDAASALETAISARKTPVKYATWPL